MHLLKGLKVESAEKFNTRMEQFINHCNKWKPVKVDGGPGCEYWTIESGVTDKKVIMLEMDSTEADAIALANKMNNTA